MNAVERRLQNARAWLSRAEDDLGTAEDLIRWAPGRIRSILHRQPRVIQLQPRRAYQTVLG